MPHGLADSIIPDTHNWEEIRLEVRPVDEDRVIYRFAGYRCKACGFILPGTKVTHGSDERRACPRVVSDEAKR
jgi:hypothetical protein